MDLSSPGHVDLFNIFFHLLGKELLSELSANKTDISPKKRNVCKSLADGAQSAICIAPAVFPTDRPRISASLLSSIRFLS